MTPKRIPTETIVSSVEAVLSRQRDLSEPTKDNIRSRIASTIQLASLTDNNLTKDERQALKRLRNNNDILILPADKGRVTVVMDKTDYHDKMDELVNDRPITTLRKLLTNVKDKDQPRDRQGAVYKIKCCDCQATYIGETGRNLNTRLTEHRRATRNGDINNNIAEHHLQTNHRIDWDSATCVTYNTNYYQRIVLESWFTNLEQTPINRCLQLPAPYKRLIDDINRQTTH